jgi:hypothetical protein
MNSAEQIVRLAVDAAGQAAGRDVRHVRRDSFVNIQARAAIALALLDLTLFPKPWERDDAEEQYREACEGPEVDPYRDPTVSELRFQPEREWP